MLVLLVFLIEPGCSVEHPPERCAFDAEAIKRADQAYATAWIANDSEQVMATLTEDPLIMPSGIPALRGTSQVRGFWWPAESPPTTVTKFDLVQHELGGQGGFAFVRGSFILEFQFEGQGHTGIGDYLSIVQCSPDGTWRISHRAWNDLPQPSD